MIPAHRDTIFVEDAIILEHRHWPDDQHILRLSATNCASKSIAGQFVHLQCDPSLALRRPLSILRSNPEEGWIELLYKVVGHGTTLLAKQQEGATLSLLGPIGNSFKLNPECPHKILIGGGVGIPPMLFLAESIALQFLEHTSNIMVFMGSEAAFPFDLVPSNKPVSGVADNIELSLSDMETLGIASRLASQSPIQGCHQGYVTELVEQHLLSLDPALLEKVEAFACGPLPMLKSVRMLADSYNIACQVSLEEHMACAVGGCAGCVVKISTGSGEAMKRVCVDGPVFSAESVVF